LTDIAAQQAKQEAERQAIQQKMAEIRDRVEGMRGGTPAAAEHAHQWIKEQCTDTHLPMDFKRQVLERARAYECDVNMRATDALLANAVHLAAEERMAERAVKLSEARTLFGKACKLGANDHFRRATARLIETAMLTGGVYRPGVATRAKPLDTAPKNPHLAKA